MTTIIDSPGGDDPIVCIFCPFPSSWEIMNHFGKGAVCDQLLFGRAARQAQAGNREDDHQALRRPTERSWGCHKGAAGLGLRQEVLWKGLHRRRIAWDQELP